MISFEFSLHHIQLAIPEKSEESCRKFYVGILGMTEVAKPPELAAKGGVWFQSGELQIHLGVEAEFVPAKKAHPGILVDRLDELAARLEAHGFDVGWDDSLPGYRRFYTPDNNGNRLEFIALS